MKNNPQESTTPRTTNKEVEGKVVMSRGNPRGGEWMDCLAASELDQVLQTVMKGVISAMVFYNYRRGGMTAGEFAGVMRKGVREHGSLFVPIHIRHHWVLLVVREEGGLRGEVYDSAPSYIVRKDITKLLSMVSLEFRSGMRQLRGSNECGIFVLANAIRLAAGLEVESPPLPEVASLAHCREGLAKGEFARVIDLFKGRDFPLLTGGDWGADLSNEEIDEALSLLGLQALKADQTTRTTEGWGDILPGSGTTIVPVWSASHWLVGVLTEGTLTFMNSAPQARHVAKMESVARSMGLKAWEAKVPRQPGGTDQCGVHLIVNALLSTYGIVLSMAQFPVLDLDPLRAGGGIDPKQIFECLFGDKVTEGTMLQPGQRFVSREASGEWRTGVVRQRRRGMITVEGWGVSLPPSTWSPVWLDTESHLTLVLQEATKSLVFEPPTPQVRERRAREVMVDIPIPAQYQNVRASARPRAPGETPYTGNLELLSADVLAFLERAPTSSGFHFTSEGSFPPPDSLKVRDLVNLVVLEHAAIPHLARSALAASTVSAHRAVLEGFRKIEPDLHELPLDAGLIEWYTRLAIRIPWRGSSLETKLSSTAGALRLLPLYCTGRSPIIMGQSVIWAQACRAAHKRALHEVKKKAVPAQWSTVERLATEFQGEAGLLILMSYCACARVGDACRLRREDVAIGPSGTLVTFRKAKTTMKRGAYTVPMALPNESPLAARLLEYIRGKTGFLFPKRAYKAAKVLLRTVGLTLHSLRRGAVQKLADSGMPPTEMIKFTGHSSVESLISYLDDGVLDPNVIRGVAQGAVLFGAGSVYTADFAPSMEDIFAVLPSEEEKRKAPLHFTKVPHMNLNALEELEVEDEAVRCFLKEALEWTRNPMKYEALLVEGVSMEEERVSPLNDAMMKALLEAKCSLAGGKVRSEVFPFGVTELKVKEDRMYYRRRPIFEPTINKMIKSITPIRLTALGDNVKGARAGRAVVQLDFVSFYDQIPLEEAVRLFFGVRWKSVYYTLKSLPMGLRVSVMVACAITWFLVNFPHEGVTINTYVDNVRFAGDPEGVITAVLEFVARCKKIGATLDNMPETRQEVEKLWEVEGDFLGVRFNYGQQTMRLTTKTAEKIRMVNASVNLRGVFSFRLFTVVMGLYNFAARVVKFPAFEVFHLLRRYREEAANEALFPREVWGTREIQLSEKEWEDLCEMERFFTQNEWVSFEQEPPVDMHIFSDACGTGWGGLLRSPSTGETRVTSGRWSDQEIASKMFEASAISEPEGLIKVWEEFKEEEFSHAMVFLDHEPLVWGCQRGRPHSFHYNKALKALSGNKAVSVKFCPGVLNPADYPSREMEVPAQKMAGLAELIATLEVEEYEGFPDFMR
jgi:hypothetical protein